jgi:hypothetical protein
VNLNFFFSFFHRHLELIFSVLKTVHGVSFHIDSVSESLDLKLHDIMLYKCLLFRMLYFSKFNCELLILDFNILEFVFELLFLGFDLLDLALDIAAFILELFVAGD